MADACFVHVLQWNLNGAEFKANGQQYCLAGFNDGIKIAPEWFIDAAKK